MNRVSNASWTAVLLLAIVGYQWRETDYQTASDPVTEQPDGITGGISPGGWLMAGRYRTHTPSLNLALSPWARLHFTGTLAYQNADTSTAANGSASIACPRFTCQLPIRFRLRATSEPSPMRRATVNAMRRYSPARE